MFGSLPLVDGAVLSHPCVTPTMLFVGNSLL
jgi:hypothetical protein